MDLYAIVDLDTMKIAEHKSRPPKMAIFKDLKMLKKYAHKYMDQEKEYRVTELNYGTFFNIDDIVGG